MTEQKVDNVDKYGWPGWKVQKSFNFPTTATIYSKKNINIQHLTTTHLDPYDSDDATYTRKHEYNQIKIKIIPQIGCRAGIPQIWTFHKPGKITYDTKDKTKYNLPHPHAYCAESTQNESNLIKRFLPKAHCLNYNENSEFQITHMKKENIKIPFMLDTNKFSNLLNVPQLIGKIILELLGITELKLNFLPSHIFDSPLSINIIENMSMEEINTLIIIKLSLKHPNLKYIPKLNWYDNKGFKIINNKYDNNKLNEFTLIFNVINNNMNKNVNKYLILNVVGKGYKTIYFNNFKDVKYKQLILYFLEFESNKNIKYDNGIFAMYPCTRSRLIKIFNPHTRIRDRSVKTYPDKQDKKYLTFDYEKYKKEILEKDLNLFEMGININGCLIEMYHITGPAIGVCFASMVGDSRIMDINLNWSLDTFKEYAIKFGHGRGCRIEQRGKHQTLNDMCQEMEKSKYSRRIILRY